MKKIKLAINGKEVPLTDEQLKAFGVESNKRINPFETVVRFEDYYSVEKNNEVYAYMDTGSLVDNQLYDAANYFNDKSFAKQVALHQLLYRKLLKFAYDNGFEDTAKWDGVNPHWHITYNKVNDVFITMKKLASKELTIYFSTEEGAERAIGEVVEPFMKEHPEFVW